MSYFDDNEDRIIYGGKRGKPRRETIRGPYRPEPAHNRALRSETPPRGEKAPPGSPLARARMAAHSAFDPLWQSGTMSRSDAYRELAYRMGLPRDQAHMVLFTVEQCERVVQLFMPDEFEDLTK